VPRQALLAVSTVVAISSEDAEHRVQSASDRRAVLNAIIDAGGRCAISKINADLKFDARTVINGLLRRGWLKIVKEES
jgi:hypothetical protein